MAKIHHFKKPTKAAKKVSRVVKYGVKFCTDYPSPAPYCSNNKFEQCPMLMGCPFVNGKDSI